jgi:hypothetical protein
VCKKLQIGMDFRYTEKRKSLCLDESTRRRRALTLGEKDIETHSLYGFETPLMEHRVIPATNGKSHSSPYLYVLLVFAHYYTQQSGTGIKMFPEVVCICPSVNPSTPELNPSAQRCLTKFFTEDFAS